MADASVRRPGSRLPILGVLTILLAGCGGDDNSPAGSANAGSTSSSPTATNQGATPERNGAPVIQGDPAKAIMPGEKYTFIPEVADADGDPLQFRIFNRPDWLQFNASTGVLSGTPTLDDAGHYPNVIIRVSDGYASSQLWPFSIDVMPTEVDSAFLTWVPPTEYEDGSPFYELAGYRVRYGVNSGQYSDLIEIPDPYTTVLGLDFLSNETYYFVITAFSHAGAESDFSNEEQIALN